MKYLAVLSVAMVSTVVLSACAGGGGDETDTPGTVAVSMYNHPWTDQAKKLIPEFEAETGIKVDLSTSDQPQLEVKYNVQLNSGSSDLDVIMFSPQQNGKLYVQNNWMTDLTEYANASSEWDWHDFQPGPRESVTIDDKIYGVPIVTDTNILYYNKELLEAAGVAVPTTVEELESAAKTLTKDGVSGFISRGALTVAVSPFSSFLFSFGGDYTDASGNASVDSPEAIAAFEYYGKLLKDYGPAGVGDMSWPQAMPVFTSGKAAMMTDADSLFSKVTDPAESQVADNVGYAMVPAGADGSKTYNVSSNGLAINQASKNKDNAWKFIEWITNKTNTITMQAAGVPSARASAWSDPEGTKGFPADLLDVMVKSRETGVGHNRPQVIQVARASEVVSGPITAAINGQDVEAAAKIAQKNLQEIIEEDK